MSSSVVLSHRGDLPSYRWENLAVVGLTGLEPVTLRLSSACSNQLSYRPALVSRHSFKEGCLFPRFLRCFYPDDHHQGRTKAWFSRFVAGKTLREFAFFL